MLAKLAEYAPNVAQAVVGRLVQTPLWLERELGLLRGNVMHLEMSVNQMFNMRPALGMSNYRGPVKGLYLTGASTHPGGGIMGAGRQKCGHSPPSRPEPQASVLRALTARMTTLVFLHSPLAVARAIASNWDKPT